MTVPLESANPPGRRRRLEASSGGTRFRPAGAAGRVPPGARRRAAPELNDVDPTRPGADAGIGVEDFLGVDGVLGTMRRLGSRLRGDVLPIADAEGGNYVCMSRDDGSVWFWDHELEDTDPVGRVADSLDAFLTMLRPFDVETVEFTDEEKSGWINPELLREMGVDPAD